MTTTLRSSRWPHDLAGGLWRDLAYAARALAHHRGASAVAVLSMALAIGPNSAVFSIMDRVFLQGGLARASSDLLGVRARTATGFDDLSYVEYREVAERNRVFERLVASYRMGGVLSADGSRELLASSLVSGDYFAVLGVRGRAGRLLDPDRDNRGTDAVPAVISDDLWTRRFSGAPDVIGRSVLLNDRTVAIVGVAERGFRDLNVVSPIDMWLPLEAWLAVDAGTRQMLGRREAGSMQVMALMRPGITKAEALDDLRTLSSQLAHDYPVATAGRSFVAWPARDDDRRKRVGVTVVALGLAGLVLLVACTNVGTMLLARAESRRRETAVRLALGASRWQLFRLFVAEALLLSIGAGIAGLALAQWLLWLSPALKPVTLVPIVFSFEIGAPVIAYTAALALVTTVVCSLMPLWQSTPRDLSRSLKDAAVGDARARRFGRSRFATLMAAQIFVTQVLLCGAGLLVRSYQHTLVARPGFDPAKNVLMLTLLPAAPGAEGGAAAKRYFALADTLAALPGVRRVSFVGNPPLSGFGDLVVPVQRESPADLTPLRVPSSTVGLDYFDVLGTRVLQGRAFERRDVGQRAAVINEMLARRAFPSLRDSSAAVGRWIRSGARTLEVIGVAEDGKYGSLREAPQPHLFLLAPDVSTGGTTLLVETNGRAEALAATARQAVQAADPGSWIASVTTLEEHARLARALDEFGAIGTAALGLLSMLLAAIGLFGLTAFWVQRRMKECGIRLALGAEPRDVVALLQRQAMRPVVVGTSIGLVGGLLLSRVLSSVLFGVRAYDPLALGGATAFTLLVSAAATRIPARRCRTVVVNRVLRQE